MPEDATATSESEPAQVNTGSILTPIPQTAELVMMVVNYSNAPDCQSDDGWHNVDWNKVAAKMGWTREQLDEFRAINSDLIELGSKMVLQSPGTILPPTDTEIVLSGTSTTPLYNSPTDEQLAMAVEAADSNLPKGLRSLGLNQKEIGIAQSLAAFNKGYFKESMDMISSGVLVTAIKLQGQQREIEDRMKFVRTQIEEFGMFNTDDRKQWVNEEKLLTLQYIEIGRLLNDIQETWYRGAGYLALVRARMRGDTTAGSYAPNGSRKTQRMNKPGFRPTVTINPEAEP